jgi:hypothetical protein
MLFSALSSRTKRSVLCAALVALPLALFAACTAEQGTTPTCEPDVTEMGNLRIETGCNAFAVCLNDQRQKVDPETNCCNGLDGCELAECMYSFGEEVDLATLCGKGGTNGGGGGGS